MRHIALVALVGLGLVGPASAQGIGQMLQGLTTGDHDRDDALRQAYERGYRNGTQDAMRSANRDRDRDNTRDRGSSYERSAPPPDYRR